MESYLRAPTANGPLDPLEVRCPAGATPAGRDCFAISMEHTLRKRKIFAEIFRCAHDFEAANPRSAGLSPMTIGTDQPPWSAGHPHSGLRVTDPKLAAWLDLRPAAGGASVEREPPVSVRCATRTGRPGTVGKGIAAPALAPFALSHGGTRCRGAGRLGAIRGPRPPLE